MYQWFSRLGESLPARHTFSPSLRCSQLTSALRRLLSGSDQCVPLLITATKKRRGVLAIVCEFAATSIALVTLWVPILWPPWEIFVFSESAPHLSTRLESRTCLYVFDSLALGAIVVATVTIWHITQGRNEWFVFYSWLDRELDLF